MATKPTIKEAAQVLLDDISGLGPCELVGQINPVAIKNLRDAIASGGKVCGNKECGIPIFPKPADVRRGWGEYCSKSCKAKKQSSRR